MSSMLMSTSLTSMVVASAIPAMTLARMLSATSSRLGVGWAVTPRVTATASALTSVISTPSAP